VRLLKILFLTGMKWLGLFYISRRLSRKYLRILCYHGISFRDEHKFRGKLFMQEDLFERRMALLKKLDYPVIGLNQAVAALDKQQLPDNAVVITFDDGWNGTFSKAVPILQKYNFPVTIYVTSYFAEKQIPVLDVLLSYIIWKSPLDYLDLAELDIETISQKVDLRDGAEIKTIIAQLEQYLRDSDDRDKINFYISKLCKILQVDYSDILDANMFMLADPSHIGTYAQCDGVKIELHTHHHRLPEKSYAACYEEIEENRRRLEQWTGQKCEHFCYPSGHYREEQIPWLEKMAIKSATTVKAGMNKYGDNKMELSRILDGEDITDIEFEAEVCGILSLFRIFKMNGEKT